LEVLEAALPFFLKILEVLGLPILTLFAIDGSCPCAFFAISYSHQSLKTLLPA